jgi:hypothetical protein
VAEITNTQKLNGKNWLKEKKMVFRMVLIKKTAVLIKDEFLI